MLSLRFTLPATNAADRVARLTNSALQGMAGGFPAIVFIFPVLTSIIMTCLDCASDSFMLLSKIDSTLACKVLSTIVVFSILPYFISKQIKLLLLQ